MSRCFPFPPPGYAGQCSSHEALIFSIKLQKERERAMPDNAAKKLIPENSKPSERREDKEDRKEKKDKESKKRERKDKKERKKEKKEKQKGEAKVISSLECKEKLQGSSAELLERSGVTEEHGQPIDSQNTPCSSDSTGNSGKRKRSAASSSCIKSNGNVIRIRFSSSQKSDEPSTSGSKEQEFGPVSHVQPCDPLLKSKSSINSASTSTNTLQIVPSVDNVSHSKEQEFGPVSHVQPCDPLLKLKSSINYASTSTNTLQIVPAVDNVSHSKERTSQKEKLSSREKKMRKKESLYNKLFVDWVAPPLERTLMVGENQDDEEEWFFGKKGEDASAKRLRVGEEDRSHVTNLSCLASASLQPRAQLLLDVGIYALPFTVPF